ncbi:MAG: hypothetical protein CYPHOPRED_003968 [Cyphobasidiales sp. Tagirdzhanova-0007]|nr:MAG: hypothetical protein CYPHOPRED_003968 [Cyphobasidiales sp. Tagirdzhanova-0007]
MPRPSSTADLYPPLAYNSLSRHPDAAASTEYLGAAGRDSPQLGSQLYQDNGSTSFFRPFDRDAPEAGYGEKYSDGLEGSAQTSLRTRASNVKKRGYAGTGDAFASKRQRYGIIGAVVLLAVIVAAVAGGVAVRHSSNKSALRKVKGIPSGSSVSSSSDGIAAIENSATIGGNGSLITTEDGSTFTYVNNFGGYWSSVAFDDSARPQSWVPALNESWDYTNNKIYGVNIGGWLVLEPFIVPGVFEPYENDTEPAVDEYTLMGKWGANATTLLTQHYETFVTEQDFARIAGAGMSWVRVALPFWAIETIEGEPFVEGVAWTYFLKAVTWARKYGLRINLDLHTMPGSQNGWNHSGKLGSVNFLNSTNAIFNAQRGLNYIRTLAEFISQPQYSNVIPMFSIVNEPQVDTIGNQTIREFYLEAYNIIRNITGIGAGKGPFISLHDGFQGFGTWAGFMEGADRIALDQHDYLAFVAPNNDSVAYDAAKPCSYWANQFYMSQQNFGLSYSGEWALDINDCGEYLNNVGNGARYDGTYIAPGGTKPLYNATGSCESWNDWQSWDDTLKQDYQQVAYAHMDALQNWFFWTWTIGNSTKTGLPPNPMWNMKLGLSQGYFPTDPRMGNGTCARVLSQQGFAPLPATATFSAFPSPWMTGGAGAGTIAPNQTSLYGIWPPTSITLIGTYATNLPAYTATGTPITLSASTPTAYPTGATTTIAPGNGWADAADTMPAYATISGCSYPLPYDGVSTTPPAARCTGA